MQPDVVLVGPYPAPGRSHGVGSGVASYTAHLARALTAQGASVAVVAPDEPEAPSVHSDRKVMVVRSGPRGPLVLNRAVRMATRMHPRVIHLQHELFLFGGLASLASLPRAVRHLQSFSGAAVVTVHQVVGEQGINPRLMRLHRLRGPVAAARMGIHSYHRLMASVGRTIIHEPGFSSQFPDGVVIPHGVERKATPDRERARQRLKIGGERRLVVLCFGFVAPYKGLDSALAATATVPDALLVVAGGDHPRHGPRYTEALRSRWEAVARFTGWVPDEEVASWHAAADLALFCYPAPHSSSGAVAVALGHGTPILASDALADSMNLPQELAVSLDPDALAGRLRRLAANRESLAELRRCSARVAASRLWPDVARRHLRLYEETSENASIPRLPPVRGQIESV
jgi:glycosyltransferase involved in cell wall biosynthesis